jgi:hypothetical protein
VVNQYLKNVDRFLPWENVGLGEKTTVNIEFVKTESRDLG